MTVPQPFAVRLFALLFCCAVVLAAALAVHSTRGMTFGFALAPDAAATLVRRIFAIRMAGIGLAVLLMLGVVLAGSRAARGMLLARWLLGMLTSTAFLSGTGMVGLAPGQGMMPVAASLLQLGIEAVAILLLYGEDAAGWFAPAPLRPRG